MMRVLNALRVVVDSVTQKESSTELLKLVNIPVHRAVRRISEASTQSRRMLDPVDDPQFEKVVYVIVGTAVLSVAEIYTAPPLAAVHDVKVLGLRTVPVKVSVSEAPIVADTADPATPLVDIETLAKVQLVMVVEEAVEVMETRDFVIEMGEGAVIETVLSCNIPAVERKIEWVGIWLAVVSKTKGMAENVTVADELFIWNKYKAESTFSMGFITVLSSARTVMDTARVRETVSVSWSCEGVVTPSS